jgi:hypothetical protein
VVLLDDAGVLHGHLPAGEGDHAPAETQVLLIKGRAVEGLRGLLSHPIPAPSSSVGGIAELLRRANGPKHLPRAIGQASHSHYQYQFFPNLRIGRLDVHQQPKMRLQKVVHCLSSSSAVGLVPAATLPAARLRIGAHSSGSTSCPSSQQRSGSQVPDRRKTSDTLLRQTT